MPIKLGSMTVNPPDIQSAYLGSYLVYMAAKLLTVTGVSPLSLMNALAKPMQSLVQFGKCIQNGTPTPSAPVDILCNNGALGFVNDNIPEEYIQLEYLESTGTQYIDSGVKINYAQAKNEQIATVQYTKSNSDRELMGSNGYGFFGKSSSNKFESASGSVSPVTESALLKSVVSLMTDPSTKSVTFNVNGTQYAITASTLADNFYNVYIFALGGRNEAPASYFCNARVYDYIIKIDDIIIAHLLPARRRSDGVLGMYDTVTNTFRTNAGTGTFVAGHAVGHIGVIGAPEVLKVSGANLLDPTTVLDENHYINRNNGELTIPGNGIFRHSDYISITPNTTYYLGHISFSAAVAGMAFYDETKKYLEGYSGTQLAAKNQKVTSPSGAAFMRFSWRIDEDYDTDWEHSVYLCIDGTIDSFVPYCIPQIASVANLYAVGDYKDEQNIINGAVTRRIGAKALDGTETWSMNIVSGINRFNFIVSNALYTATGRTQIICSHFSFQPSSNVEGSCFLYASQTMYFIPFDNASIDTVDKWKAYLAAQYNSGTPVIVLYPLANEITEIVAPQTLNTFDGTNTILTVSDVDPIELSAEIWGRA